MNDLFLRACRREPVERTPVWFMRQAGRFLPQYRELRAEHGILELCRTPDLAAEIALMPVRQLGVDAAILFSDITIPLLGVGIELRIDPDVGPMIEEPIASARDTERLRALEPEEDIPFLGQTIRILTTELDVPIIGFSGAPFTLASYLVEGGPSRTHARTKALMYGEPQTWRALMDRLTDLVVRYLRYQVAEGVHAIQLFDSWVGSLSPGDYAENVLPWTRRIFAALGGAGVPRIHFGVMTGELLELMGDAGADVVGVDWRVPLDRAWERVGSTRGIQGNLDPAVAAAGPWDVVERHADDVLTRAGGRPGHVFNLGHGVLPETPPDTLRRLVDHVHEGTAAAKRAPQEATR